VCCGGGDCGCGGGGGGLRGGLGGGGFGGFTGLSGEEVFDEMPRRGQGFVGFEFRVGRGGGLG